MGTALNYSSEFPACSPVYKVVGRTGEGRCYKQYRGTLSREARIDRERGWACEVSTVYTVYWAVDYNNTTRIDLLDRESIWNDRWDAILEFLEILRKRADIYR